MTKVADSLIEQANGYWTWNLEGRTVEQRLKSAAQAVATWYRRRHKGPVVYVSMTMPEAFLFLLQREFGKLEPPVPVKRNERIRGAGNTWMLYFREEGEKGDG